MKNFSKKATDVAMVALGQIAQTAVKNRLLPMVGTMGQQPLVQGGVPFIAGILLMGSKSDNMYHLGLGMASGALTDYARRVVPAIGEIEGSEELAEEIMSGLDTEINEVLNGPEEVLEGADPSNVLNGMDDLSEDLSEDLGEDMGEDLGEDMSEDLGELTF